MRVSEGGTRRLLVSSFLPALSAAWLVAAGAASARDLYVGKDGLSVAKAIQQAQAGDTVHLEPVVYRESAVFQSKKGEEGRPITLDGHGATLEGSDPLDPAQWREVEPGLFAASDLLPRLDDFVLVRWFFLWEGRMNHMGRTSKGRKAAFLEPAALVPGQWTFVREPARETAGSSQVYGTFYVKLAPGRGIGDAGIRVPKRSAGVGLGGVCEHLVIRNVTVTHVHNDGFNIHGDCRSVVFENIRAIECGDDGISAHESAQYRVDGFVSVGNSTGITDTGTAHTSYRRVFVADNLAYDLFFLHDGRYEVRDAVVWSSAERALQVSAGPGQHSELRLENVLVRRVGARGAVRVDRDASLFAKRFTLENDALQGPGVMELNESVVDGAAVPAGSSVQGADVAGLVGSVVPAEYRERLGR